jgi:hypothetical protein
MAKKRIPKPNMKNMAIQPQMMNPMFGGLGMEMQNMGMAPPPIQCWEHYSVP